MMKEINNLKYHVRREVLLVVAGKKTKEKLLQATV